MSGRRTGHLIERAVERMTELGESLTSTARPIPVGPKPAAVEITARVADEQVAGQAPAFPPDDVTTNAKTPTPPPPPALAPISMATLEAAGLVVAGSRRSRISEEWRVTSGNLLRKLREPGPQTDRPANLLMITSSKPGEGKTFCSLNLAGIFTLGGMSEVLLVDVDSKRGSLSSLLGLDNQLGLFDLVADPTLRVEDLMVPTAIAGLSVLPIGRIAIDDEPGIVGRAVTRPVVEMIERLARRFPKRVVILDAAPALATSDPATLAPSVGEIGMIVEAESTQHDDLEAALELLRPSQNITLILNKVRQVTKHSFGHYYAYDA